MTESKGTILAWYEFGVEIENAEVSFQYGIVVPRDVLKVVTESGPEGGSNFSSNTTIIGLVCANVDREKNENTNMNKNL